ncbi:MAG TPA: glycosyltransferase family 39 protein [Actinocrinis sp.]|nr:glycosyltransferase family 39 protein [Actinocrinis sp.]
MAEVEQLTAPSGGAVARPAGRAARARSAYTWFRTTGWQPTAAWAGPHLALTALMLGILSHAGMSPNAALRHWDGDWYIDIAQHGYVHKLSVRPDGTPHLMNIAFFPLYPYLMRVVHLVTGLPVSYAGVFVSFIAGLAAVVGIYYLLKPYIGPRAAIVACALWGVVPSAFIESMVYTEALFTALCVWAMVAMLREKWLTVCALTILAGLTRSTVIMLLPVVCAAALPAIVRGRGGWRAWVCLLASPLGLLAFLGFLAVRFHRLDAWFFAQTAPGWRSSFDYGHYTLHVLKSQLLFEGLHATSWLPFLIATAILIPAVFLTVLMVLHRRLPWQLIAWTVLTLVVALTTSGTYGAKPRFLLPAVALLATPAAVLAKARRTTLYSAMTGLTVLGAWIGAYFLDFAHFPP